MSYSSSSSLRVRIGLSFYRAEGISCGTEGKKLITTSSQQIAMISMTRLAGGTIMGLTILAYFSAWRFRHTATSRMLGEYDEMLIVFVYS